MREQLNNGTDSGKYVAALLKNDQDCMETDTNGMITFNLEFLKSS